MKDIAGSVDYVTAALRAGGADPISGSRSNMLNLKRFIVERDPGPMNLERWAGDFAGDVP
ncbi:hypothetical protein [Cryobacterium sp. HLT2-28]|uniref:hypothetical protein n=1 Tax=Cryobacterium sp. HLT2-28 TaxID=1259146 RepID=UPI001069E41E|nr:hypothetical protein [Cryobacterium sp. HLT2-28]TFB94550.1 hypothetical protein E3O48_08025 [Cryobacterium sp. HLT2-28]